MFDQLDLPSPRPFLQILFTLDRVLDVRELFVVDQSMNLIFFREARHGITSMLVNTSYEIIGDADVKRPVSCTGHDVDVIHPLNTVEAVRILDCRVKPGNDNKGGVGQVIDTIALP